MDYRFVVAVKGILGCISKYAKEHIFSFWYVSEKSYLCIRKLKIHSNRYNAEHPERLERVGIYLDDYADDCLGDDEYESLAQITIDPECCEEDEMILWSPWFDNDWFEYSIIEHRFIGTFGSVAWESSRIFFLCMPRRVLLQARDTIFLLR